MPQGQETQQVLGIADRCTGMRLVSMLAQELRLPSAGHAVARHYAHCPPNTGDKLRSSNTLRLRLLHPLVGLPRGHRVP